MRDLKMQWSRAFDLVCEVDLKICGPYTATCVMWLPTLGF